MVSLVKPLRWIQFWNSRCSLTLTGVCYGFIYSTVDFIGHRIEQVCLSNQGLRHISLGCVQIALQSLLHENIIEKRMFFFLLLILLCINIQITSILCAEISDLYSATEEINSTGFGRIFPAPTSNDRMETEEEEDEIPSEFISRRDLEKNRLSSEGTTVRINYLIIGLSFVATNSLNKYPVLSIISIILNLYIKCSYFILSKKYEVSK